MLISLIWFINLVHILFPFFLWLLRCHLTFSTLVAWKFSFVTSFLQKHGWEFELIVINVVAFSDVIYLFIYLYILLGFGVHHLGHLLCRFESWCPIYWTQINQHNSSFTNVQYHSLRSSLYHLECCIILPSFEDHVFFNLVDSNSKIENTWGSRRVFITDTQILSAEHGSIVYPALFSATRRNIHATISVSSTEPVCSVFLRRIITCSHRVYLRILLILGRMVIHYGLVTPTHTYFYFWDQH